MSRVYLNDLIPDNINKNNEKEFNNKTLTTEMFLKLASQCLFHDNELDIDYPLARCKKNIEAGIYIEITENIRSSYKEDVQNEK